MHHSYQVIIIIIIVRSLNSNKDKNEVIVKKIANEHTKLCHQLCHLLAGSIY